VTFSRDWLAGSGKKRAMEQEDQFIAYYNSDEAHDLANSLPAATWNALLSFLESHAQVKISEKNNNH